LIKNHSTLEITFSKVISLFPSKHQAAMNITLRGTSDADDWPRFTLGFPPNTPLTAPQKRKAIREQTSKANMSLILHPPPPENQVIAGKEISFPAESVDLLLDLGPPTAQEQSRENGNRYMKDLELLIPIHSTFLCGDTPNAMDHSISLCSDTDQILPKPPANIDPRGGEFSSESDLIDITPERAVLSSSIPINSPGSIEKTIQGSSENSGKFKQEHGDTDTSDIGEIESTPEPVPEPKKSDNRTSKRRLQRRGDFSKW
jgi:hypothetical protein